MTTAIAPSTDAVVGSIRSKLVEQGALHSIRAQLREHVYAALLNTVDKGSTARPSLAGTPNERLALALLDDFCNANRLLSTASTASAEINGWNDRTPASAAAEMLHLDQGEAPEGQPLLVQLIAAWLSAGPSAAGQPAGSADASAAAASSGSLASGRAVSGTGTTSPPNRPTSPALFEA